MSRISPIFKPPSRASYFRYVFYIFYEGPFASAEGHPTSYKDFLTLWKGADPDVPILKEAKAEYAKL